MMSVLMTLQVVSQQISSTPGKCAHLEKEESSDSFKLRSHFLIHAAETCLLTLSAHSLPDHNERGTGLGGEPAAEACAPCSRFKAGTGACTEAAAADTAVSPLTKAGLRQSVL